LTRLPRDVFWDRPEMAARMGDRPADGRMVALLQEHPDVRRVLDVGCAGGRNADWLAERGYDVWAFDAAATMVGATRDRVAAHLGRSEAQRRVRQAEVEDDAAWAPDGRGDFDLILALGVLQDLPDAATFRAALRHLAGALAPGGRVLVANFGPDSRPEGTPLQPIPGEAHAYLGFAKGGRRMTLPDPATLDRWFAEVGLRPEVPTAVAQRPTEAGTRTTINARYRAPG
jgi:SAM-dependent methyltransferase